ncbi:AAA family ATPase [Litoribacter alkaliphilus]|uniref:AAA family ATPase n=1 Tax=Litoribacter ruber TaxID=702568 RepID=A0AAP2CIM0_9BACT|nr:AAA family ATPase [Litoribacter alkaliphilus]MBS9525421.1 AAA family ATPase [Litoribacter alkaliphilus]
MAFPQSSPTIQNNDPNWARLKKAFEKLDSKNEFPSHIGVLVTGLAGSGKSTLIQSFISEFYAAFPLLQTHHKKQQRNIPYSEFKDAIGAFIGQVYQEKTQDEFLLFSKALKGHFGKDFPVILEYIPELNLLAGQHHAEVDKTVPSIENQLYPLILKLFQFIRSYFGQPVILFTDDLQWMSEAEINLLKFLLAHLQKDILIWVGALRPMQGQDSPIPHLIDSLGFENRVIEQIGIESLNKSQSKLFIENQLDGPCSPHIVDLCHKLSKGKLLHLQLILEDLKTRNLLQKNGREWSGDIAVIQSRLSNHSLENFHQVKLNKLSPETQKLVQRLVCIGSISKKLLLEWYNGDSGMLDKMLHEGLQQVILSQKGQEIQIRDTHLGEMIYNSISQKDKDIYHFGFAQLLYSSEENISNPQLYIIAATHINLVIPFLRRSGQLEFGAILNYKAGMISKREKAFSQSKSFLKISGNLLKECEWNRVSEQIYQVYMERAKVEYYLGDFDLAEVHLDFLLDKFNEFEKRAPVYRLKIVINNHFGKYRKVLQILKQSLAELGLTLPLKKSLKKEVDLLAEKQEKGLPFGKDLPAANNQFITDLLNVGGMALHHTSDLLMNWAALQIILRSEWSENQSIKAIGYVSYARLKINAGEYKRGLELGKRGMIFNLKNHDHQYRCRVFGVYGFYILPWKEDYAKSNEILTEGIESGRLSGDLIGLYILKTHLFNLHFISGRPLEQLLQIRFEETHPRMELTYYITQYQQHLVSYLLGRTPTFGLPQQRPSYLAAVLTIKEETFYRNYVLSLYYFLGGHYEIATQTALIAQENSTLQEGSPLIPANLLILALSISQNHHADQTSLAIQEFQEIVSQFEIWAELNPANFSAQLSLLLAEKSRISQNHQEANFYYTEALKQVAADNFFLKGLVLELFAKSQLSCHANLEEIRTLLIEAKREYQTWGGQAKADQLELQYDCILSSSTIYSLDHLDIETIQKELSGDLNVKSLIQKLMVLILRFTGSTGVGIYLSENHGELNQAGMSFSYPQLAEDRELFPKSLILMAHKTKSALIIGDTEAGTIHHQPELAVRKVKSFSILPISISGTNSMVVYLENTLAFDWYNEKLIRWAKTIANQGLIIIENALIHENTIMLNKELRKEMEEKQQLAELIQRQKDDHLKAMVESLDSERGRIAGDLHDSIGSMLSSVKFKFGGIQESLSLMENDNFNGAIHMLDTAIDEVRKIAHEMSPVGLKKFGLQAALESFISNLQNARQLHINFQMLGFKKRLSEQMELVLYRICQELVQNVLKHAQATELDIQLIHHKKSINLTVEDNGKGMDTGNILHGFGFLTIQAKIKLLKGEFNIESRNGKGTLVWVDIPL